jgi:Protein of unknown function (DUF3096)
MRILELRLQPAFGRWNPPRSSSVKCLPLNLETLMHLTIDHIAPLVALIAGILILIVPRILNFVVAIYLILVGLIGLNAIHHFVR